MAATFGEGRTSLPEVPRHAAHLRDLAPLRRCGPPVGAAADGPLLDRPDGRHLRPRAARAPRGGRGGPGSLLEDVALTDDRLGMRRGAPPAEPRLVST